MQTDSGIRDRQRLLSDFDESARVVRHFVVDRYGEEGAEELHRRARESYERIIPQVPVVDGPRARMMNSFLRLTAQEVAVYKAVESRGGTPADAWEICDEAIRLRMENFPGWKRSLLGRVMFSGLARRVFRRREAKDECIAAGDFEIRYVTGDGSDFDIGIDYVRCGNLELVRELGAEAFAPYACLTDIALSDALGWGLIRSETLADGCSRCDFRFKKGAGTRISSQIPEVQETIEKIGQRSRPARPR